jgi:serpin B
MKRAKTLLLTFLICFFAPLIHAQKIFKPKVIPPRFFNDTAAIEKNSVIDNLNTFSLNLLRNDIKNTNNQLISGTSLYPLLSVLYTGSTDETRYEMRNSIGFYTDQNKNNDAIKQLFSISKSDSIIELESGIGLWAVETANFKKTYYNTLKEVYGLVPTFFNPSDSAMRVLTQYQINEWASKQTKGNITELIDSKAITLNTQLIGVTAFYFKGGWQKPFDEMFTSSDKFNISNTVDVDVDYMNQSSEFNYYETELLQAIELNYANTNYSLSIIIPHEGISLESIEKELNTNRVQEIWKDMILARIQLSIPKFAINVGGIFNPQLESLGMKLAFTNKAQFADITEQNNIKLDKFIQQCRFVIDEKGSEASAAAAATMSTKSAFIANQILTVRIDRPFIFLLRDKSQNLILMTGKITNPQKI